MIDLFLYGRETRAPWVVDVILVFVFLSDPESLRAEEDFEPSLSFAELRY